MCFHVIHIYHSLCHIILVYKLCICYIHIHTYQVNVLYVIYNVYTSIYVY